MQATTACDLFQRCLDHRGGDDWREFVGCYGGRVSRSVRGASRSAGFEVPEEDFEELVQELYCRLLAAGVGQFRGRTEHELWGYLRRVARNLIVDRQRSAAASKRIHELALARWEDRRFWVSRSASPEEKVLEGERRRLFVVSCRRFADGDGSILRVLEMALLEGRSSREIAVALRGRLNASQVDNLVHRLRRRLAQEGLHVPHRRRFLCRTRRRRKPRHCQ